MKLKKTVSELKEYIGSHDQKDVCNPLFAFTYGPMMAKNPEFAKTLDELALVEMSYIPFKYCACLMKVIENSNSTVIAQFLKNMTIDLDTLKHRHQNVDEKNWTIMENNLKQYVLAVIKSYHNITPSRKVGTESVMSGYSPIVPYGLELKKQGFDNVLSPIFAETIDDQVSFKSESTGAQNLSSLYTSWTTNADNHSVLLYWNELTRNIRGYIEFSDMLYELDSVAAAMHLGMNLLGELPDEVARLYALVYFANLQNTGDMVTDTQLSELKHQMAYLLQVDKPITDSQFASAFEAISKCESGAVKATMEAWSALSTEDQASAASVLGNTQKIYKFANDFNLDALMATMYNMRYIEYTQVANQKFIELMGDKVVNVNYMDDDMIICEVKCNPIAVTPKSCDTYTIMVPYVDIANDYAIKVVVASRDGDEICPDITLDELEKYK